MDTPTFLDANSPILDAEVQQESVADQSAVDKGNIDRDEKKDVESDVIDLESSQSDNSMQLKVDNLATEPAPENPTSSPIDEKASEPLKIEETPLVPVNTTTLYEKGSESVLTASPSSSPLPSPRRLSKMPALADLSDLILHSPSSHIIGTPFATNTTRFEYPFPDTSSSSPASGSNSPPSSSSALKFTTPIPLASGSSFPAISTSPTASQISSPSASYPMPSSDMPSYNPAHPKLKKQLNPPIPPSLQKKRTRWSLNLLGRRKSSFGSDDSSGTSSTLDSLLAGLPPQVASPLESPREERGKH